MPSTLPGQMLRLLPVLPLMLLLSLTRTAPAQTEAPLPVMPLPAHVQLGTGTFPIDNNFGVAFQGYREPRLDRAKQRFLVVLSRETGIPLWWTAQYNQPHFFIKTTGPSKPIQQLGEDESYHLVITSTEVHLEAPNPLGILHGLQTFEQLVRVTPEGFSAPAVTIDDKPRFPWRGLMIDCGRHFIPLDVLKRNLDGMEAVKLNVFHWHLSEDQGFRAESKTYPLLQDKGSDGLYYTQDQIKEIIGYARDRGIRVVPEFDMPGHATSWFVGYPKLASGPGPYQIQRTWGIHDAAMDPARESTYLFLDKFIGEMAALFPDAYFHVGGDEVNGKEWRANPSIQAFMQAHHFKDTAALQAYFTARVQRIVAKHHKIMVGWDEVLQPDTPKDVVIQSWRGQDSLARAARQGNRGILSFGYYLDLNEPASYHYSIDPMAAGAATLSPAEKQRILGGEAAMWTEYVTAENIDSRDWPWTAAIAERLWSPQEVTDVASMYARLEVVSQKLTYYGLQHRAGYSAMLERMTSNPQSHALRVLADVVAPSRPSTHELRRSYTSMTPLNRLMDAIPPESITAHKFMNLADDIAAGKASQIEWQKARQWLVLWRDNDAKLQALLPQSPLTRELSPVSTNLRQVAIVGLQALDFLQKDQPAAAGWQAQQAAFLKTSEQPQADVLNMIAPAVGKLVQATKTQ